VSNGGDSCLRVLLGDTSQLDAFSGRCFRALVPEQLLQLVGAQIATVGQMFPTSFRGDLHRKLKIQLSILQLGVLRRRLGRAC